jgi:PhzF family phenazine biosynthesis protein
MTTHEFAIVDVFADRPLTGNPLAVVIDADDLDPSRMAAVAREFNLSETTFVSDPTLAGADWCLRSFTPGGEEVAGAGHNALGAWWWLVECGRTTAPVAYQELGGRVLPVGIDAADDGRVSIGLAQGPVELTPCRVDPTTLLQALGSETVSTDDTLEIVCGSVGSVHVLLPVTSVADVDGVDPDSIGLRDVLAQAGAQGCYVYTCATDAAGLEPGLDAYARFFNPTVGIAEDPATGSAAGPLTAHLVASGRASGSVRVLQGRSMGRPSLLDITFDPGGTTLSGSCALSVTGTLRV